jgi:serine/threonine protein kinase
MLSPVRSLPESISTLGGKYQISIRIGGGSFGEIYHGRNIRTGEDLAIKVELNQNKTSQLRLEAKIYLRLSSEGIVLNRLIIIYV